MWSAWPISPTRTLLTAWRGPAGVKEEKWAEQSDRNWAHFLSVLAGDSQVLNDIGTVAQSLGFKRNLFNTAEGRLTAFHDEVMKRVGRPR
jgi:choline monooxygenase